MRLLAEDVGLADALRQQGPVVAVPVAGRRPLAKYHGDDLVAELPVTLWDGGVVAKEHPAQVEKITVVAVGNG